MQFPSPDARILPADIRCNHAPSTAQSEAQQKVVGSLVGLAIGDALGASVEFRPHQYLVDHSVKDMQGGGTWGLEAGQWTDDTSMALCLASSLLTRQGFDPYDQMVRYKWWYKKGFLSSTGQCFDIGSTTRSALEEFSQRQNILKQHFRGAKDDEIDKLSFDQVRSVPNFNVVCGKAGDAGNGPLMRLAPVPLFYFRDPPRAVQLAGESARLTHGDQKAVDACRYFAALIVAAIRGESKDGLLHERFYEKYQSWFGSEELHEDVLLIARGSYKKPRGYEDGIRGKNYIINTLEAALWAFWADENSFAQGALKAVNLGDDTDTTAAVYGQLAGACYGISKIPRQWANQLYAMNFLICVAEWLYVSGGLGQNDTSRQQRMTPQSTTTPQQRMVPQSTAPQQRITPQQTTSQQRITQQNQNQSAASMTQDRHYYDSHPLNQQTLPSKNKGIIGYDHPSEQKTSYHSSANNPSTGKLRDKNTRLDPASLPVAGKPSG